MHAEAEDPLERRLDELRRIVYGTPVEPPAGVVAELLALEHELVVREAADRGPPLSESSTPRDEPIAPAPTGMATTEPMPEGDEQPMRVPMRHRRLARALTALALAGAAIAVLGPARDLLSPPRGLEVFEHVPSAAELDRAAEVVEAAYLDPVPSSALRSLGHVVGYEVWVYRDGRSVCLLTQRDFWFSWVRSCVSLAEFHERGLVRRIPAGEISDLTRPRPVAPDDIVLVEWGPLSTGVEWRTVSDGESPR
jgi:hypothetical protein